MLKSSESSPEFHRDHKKPCDLRVNQRKELCIGFTQENSIEFLVQGIYLYILTIDGSYLAISSLS